MSVSERMQALGDHARSSRQPPLRPRQFAAHDGNTAMPAFVKSAPARFIADEVAEDILCDASDSGLKEAAVAENDSTTGQPIARDNGADLARRRAVIHEWEHWSALHSDELEDANVGKYFFSFLQQKKPHLLTFSDDEWETVHGWLVHEGRVRN